MSASETKIKSVLEPKYEIKKLIAKGGMGEVYLGIHRALNKRVAIKIVHQELSKDEDFRKRFYREARLAASLDHSGIIDIYDFGSEDDFDYIIMPYVEGSNLQEKLKREGKLELQECLQMMISMTNTLAYAHGKNVIHRDIKPANFMIDTQGNMVLTDFGISKDMGDLGLTVPGKVLGSPKYMSPEQIRGEDVDRRTDIYSLGLVFYEMVTGKHPFEGNDATSIYYCQAHEMPQRPETCAPGVSAQLADIVMKMLDKSPETRYRNGDQLLKDLESYKFSLLKDSRMDIDATLADASSMGDVTEPGGIDSPSETVFQGQRPGGMPEGIRADKRLFSKGRKLYRLVALGLSVTLFLVVGIWWLASRTDTVPDKKDYPSPTGLGPEEKPGQLSTGTADTPGSEIADRLSDESDKAPGTGTAFDSIVKRVLALGQEREATFFRLWTDKSRFRIGDTISYHFQSEKDCYLVVLNVTCDGDLIQIFPNRFSLTQFVQARKNYTIPGDEADIALEVTGPSGKEQIVALVAKVPFDLFPATFDDQDFFQVDKDDQTSLEKISNNIQDMGKLNIAQKRMSYSIVE